MVRILVFDVDDTIIKTYPTTRPMWQRAAQDFGFDMKEEELRKHWGDKGVDLVYKSLCGKATMEESEKIYRRQIEYCKDVFIPPVPGAPQALKCLAGNYVLGAMSSRSQLFDDCFVSRKGERLSGAVRYRIDAAGIDANDFLFVFGKENCRVHKPDPESFQEVRLFLDMAGHNIDDAIYVGDSIQDLTAARGAGLRFVAVLSGVRTHDDFINAGCSAENVIPSIAALPEYLKN